MIAGLVIAAIPVIGLLAGLFKALRAPQEADTHRRLEILLSWLFPTVIGASEVIGFMGHVFRADEIAAMIGWPPGSPFQYEVGIANLAFGVLGFLAIWLRGHFWTATVIGWTVWFWGDAVGHVIEIQKNGNLSPGNAGIPLYTDIGLPLLMCALLAAWHRTAKPGS